MANAVKELALLGVVIALGAASFLISSSHVDFRGFGSTSWGYPLAWHYQADLRTGGVSAFGVYLGSVDWSAFAEDLLFWMAASLAIVEGLSHIVIPYIDRKLRLRGPRPRRSHPKATLYLAKWGHPAARGVRQRDDLLQWAAATLRREVRRRLGYHETF